MIFTDGTKTFDISIKDGNGKDWTIQYLYAERMTEFPDGIIQCSNAGKYAKLAKMYTWEEDEVNVFVKQIEAIPVQKIPKKETEIIFEVIIDDNNGIKEYFFDTEVKAKEFTSKHENGQIFVSVAKGINPLKNYRDGIGFFELVGMPYACEIERI